MATDKKVKALLLTAALLGAGLPAAGAAADKGYLFIVGGGERADQLMARFVEAAGGGGAAIAVLPLASGEPEEAARIQVEQFKRLGAADVEGVLFARGQADKEENLAKVRRARAVFFTGGDQSRLTASLAGTKMLEEIRRIYREGGVVGGTSAGAAVMSRVMLTGDDRLAVGEEEPFCAIRANAVVTAEGFGFLPENIVIDQHFIKRKRQNRLLSLVLERPGLTGIGIDEATALLVGPEGAAEVLGASQATVFEAATAGQVSADKTGRLAAKGLTLHLLKAGDKYTLPRPWAAK